MPVAYPLKLESTLETPIESADTSTRLARDAIQSLGAHTHFHGRTDSIRIDCRHDTLIVSGNVLSPPDTFCRALRIVSTRVLISSRPSTRNVPDSVIMMSICSGTSSLTIA